MRQGRPNRTRAFFETPPVAENRSAAVTVAPLRLRGHPDELRQTAALTLADSLPTPASRVVRLTLERFACLLDGWIVVMARVNELLV